MRLSNWLSAIGLIIPVMTDHVSAQSTTRGSVDTVRMTVAWKYSGDEAREGEELGIVGGIAVDAAGNAYVSDFSMSNIRVFGSNGQMFPPIGRKGQGPGEFISPTGMGVGGDGFLYVRDQSRYTRFRANESTKRLTVYESVFRRPTMGDWMSKRPVRFGGANTVYEPSFSRYSRPPKVTGHYFRYSTGGEKIDSITVPLFANSPPPLAVLWSNANSGRMIQGLNQVAFAARPVWDVTPAGTVISGMGDSYLLTERNAAGQVLRTFQRTVPVERIPARERADSLAALKRRIDSLSVPIEKLENVSPQVIRRELPETFPFYSAVYTTSGGSVWVRRWLPGSDKRTVFDVFAREGTLLRTVTLPVVISFEVYPVLTMNRIVAIVVDTDTGENILYSFSQAQSARNGRSQEMR